MSARARLSALAALVALAMLALGLRPFDALAPNALHWLEPGPGLRFDGPAIAYTREPLPWPDPASRRELSLELWFEEWPGAENWAQRKIAALHDGAAAPNTLLGSSGGILFLYRRSEPTGARPWSRQFRAPEEFARGRPVFGAAVYGRGEKSLYLDGVRVARAPTAPAHGEPAPFAGRLVLGSEWNGVRGWLGILRGLAVYARALEPREVAEHGARAARDGLAALAREPGLLALYPFDEGGGRAARSLVPGSPALRLPSRFAPFAGALLRGHDGQGSATAADDAWRNVAGFVPLGALLGLAGLAGGGARRAPRLLAAWLAAALLSLAIEVGQHYLPGRDSNAVDWVCNAGGAALGVALAAALAAARSGRLRQ